MSDLALSLPLKFCRQPGCPEKTRNTNGYCAGHQQNNTSTARQVQWRQDNPLYDTSRWRNLQHKIIVADCFCRRIIAGVRCDRPSKIVHHLVSPRQRPDLMFVVSNLVAVCRDHHPNTEGSDWVEGRDYSKSEFAMSQF
jgi:hypothetical protein